MSSIRIGTRSFQQVRDDLLARREAILSAASGDAAVRDLLAKRLDWLKAQLPAGMQPSAETAAVAVPANIDTLLAKAGAAGHALALDGPQIEDNNVLLFRQKDQKGEESLRALLKVTAEGSKIIEANLAAAGASMGAGSTGSAYAAPASLTHPNDTVWPDLLTAAKHIGAHAPPNGDGVYSPTKTAILDNIATKLNALVAAGAKDMMPLQLHYFAMVADLKKAMANKTAPEKQWKQYEVPPKAKAAPEPVAAAGALAGWNIKRQDNWSHAIANIEGGVLKLTGGENPAWNVFRGWEMSKGPVTLRFAAHNTGVSRTYGGPSRALFGNVEITIRGTGAAAANQVLATLHELGLDTSPTAKPFKELLYLQKGWYIRNQQNNAEFRNIYNSDTIPIEEKILRIKELSEKTFGVKLPRSEAGWGPAYNPEGRAGAAGDGYRVFDRWDIPPEKMEKEMAGWQLHHTSGDILATVKGWLAAKWATPTYDRLRVGVGLSATGGASFQQDLETGGAVHLYTNVVKADNPAAGFRFKIRNLARLDVASHFGDTYGNYDDYNTRVSQVSDYKKMNHVGYTHDNAPLKGGLNFAEEIDAIRVRSAADKKAVVQAFKDAGFSLLPDGRTVESIVKIV